MLNRLRHRAPVSAATIRWRGIGGPAALLLGVAVSIPRAMDEQQNLLAIGLTILVVLGAWSWIALRPHVAGVGLLGGAADGDEAARLAQRHRPDVVLMDLRMPRCDGVAVTRRILAELPTTRVIVLTTYADDESVFAALEAGARGYLTKDAAASEIQRAIRTVFAGEALLEPSIQRRLLERSLASAAPQPPSYPDGLTQREVEVLQEIAAGHSNREIADRLSISEATVKTHVNNIFSKAGLRDRAQAVVYAIRRGLAG